MERFAIKISDELRLNLYNICRLCGIDNPTKIKILDSLKIPNDSDEEEPLSKKIECVVGIKVKRNDQMPQSICNLCADKINDFFEYREMCGATNIQTRKLLGIPLEAAKRKKNEKEIKVEGESILGLGILDEDITDSKSSIKQNSKQTKHRVKSRPKKKGNNSKKKVVFKDEDVKLESEEIKTEIQSVRINNKSNGKKLKVDLKKKVDSTPLLTLKEPNKRERRREIDAQKLERRRIREEQRREIEEKKREIELAKQILEQKKLEKKRKTKNSDQEPPVKKMKQELDLGLTNRHSFSCTICSETFSTNDLLMTHLHESHTVGMSTFGCSSCAESFKTINEEKDHELWHSLSKTSYICPICNVAFDKSSIFTRHITLCKPFNLTPTVSNIHCKECSGEYLTQNLYQWHDCFIKPNGRCWHCSRIFVKASSLFKHIFKCTSNQGAGESSISNIVSVPTRDHTRNKKAKSYDRDGHIKSEPEANLEIDDIRSLSSNILSADMLPVVVLTKSIFKPNQTVMVHDEQMPFTVKTENEIDFEDQSQLDEHFSHLDESFRDGDNSDDNMDELENINGFQNTMDTTETFSDDDVIFIENNEEVVDVNVVDGSPSTTRNLSDKPFVLPIVIKREPIDTTYEVVAPPMFDPNMRIKSEPVDGSGEACNEMEEVASPKRHNTKSRKTKKPNTKSQKEREQLVRIKEEPTDSHNFCSDILRTVPTHNLGSAVVSLPTTNLLSASIKSEPIRHGYDDDFDPVLALNIKKEPGLEDPSQSRVPALRLRISKKHGTLNAKLISARDQTNADDSPTLPKATKSKEKRDKEKRLYKKPALLAEKIRQEMIARMAREKENETTNQRNIDMPNDFTVPIIARVVESCSISDLPYVRVKTEPKSPCHVSQHISNSSPEQHGLFSNFNRRGSIEAFENPQIDKDIWSFDDVKSTETLRITENITTDSVGNLLFEPTASKDMVGNSTTEPNFTNDIVGNSTLQPSFPYGTAGSSTWEPNFTNDTASNSTLNNNVTKDTVDNSTLEPNVTNDTVGNSTWEPNVTNDTVSNSTLEPSFTYNTAGNSTLEPALEDVQTSDNEIGHSIHPLVNSPMEPSENQQMNFDPIEETTPINQQCDDLSVLENTYEIPDDQKATFEAIDEIINTLPLPNIEHIEKENLQLNINNESIVVKDLPNSDADVLSSKGTADESNSVMNSDNSESNSISDKISDSELNAHCCTKLPTSDKLKSSNEFLMMNGVENVEMDLLKATVNENSDYELNAVQTLTTSAIHEQLHSLLEDISDDSLSCDIDLDDKTVDWEWESKLLGD